jgi:hypothetical protein
MLTLAELLYGVGVMLVSFVLFLLPWEGCFISHSSQHEAECRGVFSIGQSFRLAQS